MKRARKKLSEEEIRIRFEVFKLLTDANEIRAARTTGHLRGGVDTERMMRIKEEFENQEIQRCQTIP